MARTVSKITSGLRDGDPEPPQPAVFFFLRDLVRAVFFQPRRRFLFAQARQGSAQPLQHGGRFLRRGVVDEISAF